MLYYPKGATLGSSRRRKAPREGKQGPRGAGEGRLGHRKALVGQAAGRKQDMKGSQAPEPGTTPNIFIYIITLKSCNSPNV